MRTYRGHEALWEGRCAVCGKELCIPDTDSWAYKRKYGSDKSHSRLVIVCSWSCLKTLPDKPIKGRHTGGGRRIEALLREGRTPDEIVTVTGCSRDMIRYWVNKMKEEKE